jgi:Outer membrane protein beta-barrel domain
MNNIRLQTLAALALAVTASGAAAQDWTVEVYGGLTGERTEVWDDTPYQMDSGNALGVGAYTDGLLPGFTVGVDVMGTRALYTGFPGEYIESLSLMAVLRKDFPLGQALEGYVAGGIGAIRNTYYDGPDDYSDTVAGAQLSLGLRHNLAGSSAIFGEVKHQAGLKDAYYDDLSLGQSYESTSVIAGYAFSF